MISEIINHASASAGGASFVVLFLLIGLGVILWAAIDAASRPSGAFIATGSSKGMWLTLIIVFSFFTGVVGLILAVVYLVSIRPKVRRAIPPMTPPRY